MDRIQMWGGVECTVNRVRSKFYRQLRFSGHETRLADLDLIADLGIRTLRYPVLWETIAPDSVANARWAWPDERLRRLRELRIDPIVGLVHHGSGPRHTSLIADDFAVGLAQYAGAVAQRYPWISAYTPVNEPLTTARFSTLYGLWYPHHRDARSFARAVINQCRGTVLAMRSIREINSSAKLLQTDDLGRIYSTPALAYQAQFENQRRWLAWDLLCGRVDREHSLWKYLIDAGLSDRELLWFQDNPCPPDIIGINHYVTSDRYLHQNRDWCPEQHWGSNGREHYADGEAVRLLREPAGGVRERLEEAWQRYGLPLAITEAHLGCTRDEQLRWLHEVWRMAQQCRCDGIGVRAVTVWAMFGSFDWNTLLTRFTGHYEPGVFDVRGPAPRPTAVAGLVKDLAADRKPHHAPLLQSPGWWHRPVRLLSANAPASNHAPARTSHCPLVITGATGTLGRAFAHICDARGIEYRLCTRADLDISNCDSIDRALDALRPWAVINAAGYVRVDQAERERERCHRENCWGAEQLASACAVRKLPVLTFSSDLVFDGSSCTPYLESDPVGPLNVYGLSKACAETCVLQRHAGALVVRTSALFGPWDQYNFLTVVLRTLLEGGAFTAMDDVIVSPTYVPDLVNVALDLLIDGERGLWHLANQGAISWADLAHQAACIANIGTSRLASTSCRNLALPAQRPKYSVLGSERGLLLPSLESALERFVDATSPALASSAAA